jgi:hypothetical protein
VLFLFLRLACWALQIIFGGAVSINFERRCNHYRLILACMLSGVSRDRPVIGGWSTALRGEVMLGAIAQFAPPEL